MSISGEGFPMPTPSVNVINPEAESVKNYKGKKIFLRDARNSKRRNS